MKFVFKKTTVLVLLLFFALLIPQALLSQEADSMKKDLKNSIKINLTNPMIFGDQCYMIGYERTIGDHQSIYGSVGRFSLPRIIDIDTDSLENVSENTKSKGFHMSLDYRFYLAKENKHHSPHGVYIGPYVTYNSYQRDFTLSANTQSFTGDLTANFGFRVASVGFQLGYQFVFWNRVSLDMILFGPGIAAYKMKTELDTTLDPDEESELFQKINDALEENIPGYDLVINPGTFEKTGSYKTTSLGFRYIVLIGIRF